MREEIEADEVTVGSGLVNAQTVSVVESEDPAPKLEMIPNPNGDGQIVAIRDGYEIQKLEGPKRARRVHAFDNLETFAQWITREQAPGADILVGETEVKARTEPSARGSDEVSCALVAHPSFVAWRTAFARPLDQRGFLQLVRGQEETLGGDTSMVLLGALQVISVDTKGDIRLETDLTGATKVFGAGEKTTINAKVPAFFTVRTPILEGVKNTNGEDAVYSLEVFVNVDLDGNRVVFTLTCPKLDLAVRQARRDAAAYLRGLLGPEYLVASGKLQTQDVPAGFGVPYAGSNGDAEDRRVFETK